MEYYSITMNANKNIMMKWMIKMDKYINFGDMCRSRLKIQCQYGSRYVDGMIEGYPNLGYNLRFKGNTNLYHSLQIHNADVEEFINRVNKYRGD